MKYKYDLVFLLILFTACIWGCKKDRHFTDNNSRITTDTSLYTVSGSGGKDGSEILLAFNTNENGVLAILDEKGNILKEKTIDLRAENFQKWNIDGKTRYTYFQGVYTKAGTAGVEEGYEFICDSNLNTLSKVSLLPFETIDTGKFDKLDLHEFILLGDNHYMAISYRQESPKNIPDSLHPSPRIKVMGCLIQEVNNGRVVFQWDGTNYPEFYASSIESNNFSDSGNTMDYMHMNSLCIDPRDNNIICSFRNINQVIKINRVTGAIMWRLGGKNSDFPLTADEVFLRQHFARLTDNDQTLIFLDNGEKDLRAGSRIVEFQLDENTKTVKNFKAYPIPDKFIQYAGSVKKSNGNYFIGGGSGNYSLEVNYTTNEVLLRLNQKYSSYRSLKY
jgi:hypothetical protein